MPASSELWFIPVIITIAVTRDNFKPIGFAPFGYMLFNIEIFYYRLIVIIF